MENFLILSDYSKTVDEIAKMLNISSTTVSRWRKKAGIKGPKGSKKGISKPERLRRKNVTCYKCEIVFEVVESSKRKYCSHDCMRNDPLYKANLANMDKSYMQTEEYKKTLMKDTTPELRRYRNRVTKLSEKTYQENIDILNPNRYNRTVCGVHDGYQLDHIISVKECFLKGLTPEEASRLENLQLLPWKTNLLKG